MSLKIPISSPLTEAQAELTSKIGSMKSLLSLPIDINLNIPKSQQISTFDYLLKVMRALGIEPELMFNLFLDKVFDVGGSFLEEKVINAVADSIGQKGRQLPNVNNPTATQEEKDAYKISNRAYLTGLVPATFLQAVKQQMAKNLTLMIFGPKDGGPASVLNPSASERERLFEDAICGTNLFSLSSDPIVLQQDVEFNRIALRKQLEKGEVIFEISCQDVKIKLPEDPSYIFEGGGQFTSSSAVPPTPSQSLSILVQHVKNQGQRINNEENSNSIGKSFFEILITKLLNYISSLVFPFLGPIFSLISNDPAGAGLDATNVAYSNCDIMNSADNAAQNPEEKQEFFKSLANALLKELLRVLLVFTIKEFKRLVANYFARTAIEKQKRKAEKIKQKFAIFNKAGQAAEALSKAKKYAAAAATLASIIGVVATSQN
jgi:hypothetical protein